MPFSLWEPECLGFQRVRCVVGSDALNGALLKLLPRASPGPLRGEQVGLHLQAGAFTSDIRFVKGEVLRKRLGRDDGSGFAAL